jgi:hypothetical protein
MPSAQSSNRHPHTMAIPPLSTPFSHHKKGASPVSYRRSTWELVLLPQPLSSSDGMPPWGAYRMQRLPTTVCIHGRAHPSARTVPEKRAPSSFMGQRRCPLRERSVDKRRQSDDDIARQVQDQITIVCDTATCNAPLPQSPISGHCSTYRIVEDGKATGHSRALMAHMMHPNFPAMTMTPSLPSTQPCTSPPLHGLSRLLMAPSRGTHGRLHSLHHGSHGKKSLLP